MGISLPEFDENEEKIIKILSAIDEKNPRSWIRDQVRRVMAARSAELPGIEYQYVEVEEEKEVWDDEIMKNHLKKVFTGGVSLKYGELVPLVMKEFGITQRQMRRALASWLKSGMVVKNAGPRDPKGKYKLGIL